MSGLLNYTSAPFERSGKGLKSIVMVATLVARNANEAMVGLAESAFGGSLEVDFVLVRLAGIRFSRREEVSTFLFKRDFINHVLSMRFVKITPQ
jgi:hypothetical protein